MVHNQDLKQLAVHLNVLHLDDDPFELERVKKALEDNGVGAVFKVKSVTSIEALTQEISSIYDVVILDVHLGERSEDGSKIAQRIRDKNDGVVILMCSTADDVSTIGRCLRAGADDFISKQSDRAELSLRVFNSYRLAKLKQGIDIFASLNSSSHLQRAKPSYIGRTMDLIAKRIPRIIDSAITAVFVTGESGTGKEMVADLFAANLPKDVPFLKVNCGAISPTLLESELFGHVKGAFTGALSDKRGLLEAASGGWVFLDEVATLSQSAQVALLRAIENQEIIRVGSSTTKTISIRVIAATNEPIEEMVKTGKFRKDLLQRLKETEIYLSPLRDRAGEVEEIVLHFCKSMKGGPYKVSGPVMEVLTNVSWSNGNIRELRNCLRAMTETHVNKLLTPISIPERLWSQLGGKESLDKDFGNAKDTIPTAMGLHEIKLPLDDTKALSFDDLTDRLLLELTKVLKEKQGKLSLRGMAKSINMSRSTLSSRLKALVDRGIISLDQLGEMVSVSEKT